MPTATTTARIELTGVHTGYRGKEVLRDITLSLHPGLSVLIGPNGSGKTTLFRLIAGILPAWSGQVSRHGDGPVGYSSHRSGLLPKLSVHDNIEFWARLQGGIPDARVDEVLTETGMTEIAGQAAATLSRGQAQRVSIARALLAKPDVLLLDEPLAGVDPGGVKMLLDLFAGLAAGGRCVVVSSHSLAELAGLDAAVIALRDGRLVAQGTANELGPNLAHTETPIRLHGGIGLFELLRDDGFDVSSERDDAVVLRPGAGKDTAAAIALATRHGIAVSEATPVRDRLSQIYDALEQGEN